MATKEEIIDVIANMTVLEVSELIKAMEEKFGVTAAAAVAAGPAAAAGPAEEVEEQTEFTVTLKSADLTKKIAAIKVVRTIVAGLGLKEAKDLVEQGGVLKEAASKEEVAEIKEKLAEVGGVIEVK